MCSLWQALLSGSRSRKQQAPSLALAHLKNSTFGVAGSSAGKWQPIRGFDEQRESNVGGAPVLSNCCVRDPRRRIVLARCLEPDISQSGAQDAQGKPGPATASGDAYGEKENGGATNAAAPARALAGKAVEDGAAALLGADISVRPLHQQRRGCAVLPRVAVCATCVCMHIEAGLLQMTSIVCPPQEAEEEKLLAPESAAEEEERLRQHRKQETERALQVAPPDPFRLMQRVA